MLASDATLQRSFEIAGVDRHALLTALRSMCPSAIKGMSSAETNGMRAAWSADNPTRFTCYFVSEMVFWFYAPAGSQPMGTPVDGDRSPHRYTLWPDRTVVDLTCDQFGDLSRVDYAKGRYLPYMQTGAKGPSLRAWQLARLLGRTATIPKLMIKGGQTTTPAIDTLF